jgi:hypothetical protein
MPLEFHVMVKFNLDNQLFNTCFPEDFSVIPEFPSWTPILLALAALTVFLAVYRKRLAKTPGHQSY